MPSVTLPLADWRPDAGALEGGTAVASGVYAISPQSYAPFQELVQQATAGAVVPPLQGGLQVMGGFGAGEDLTTGNVQIFASAVGSKTIQQVVGGTFVNAGANLLSLYDHVSFCQFKNWMIAGANYSGILYQNLASPGSAFTKVTSGGPVDGANYVAAINDFLFAGYTNDGTLEPYRVWWSGIGDPTNWPTPGSATAIAAQSDYNDFIADFGVVTGLCGQVANADGLIFFERAVQRAIYVGPPDVFNFQPIGGAPGTSAPYSIIRTRGLAFYYGQSGFVMTDGAQVQKIGAGRVDNYLASNWDHNIWHLRGAWNDRIKCAMWAITGQGGENNEVFDQILIYSPDFDKWTFVNLTSAFGGCRGFFQGMTNYGPSAIPTARQICAFLDYDWNFSLMGGDLLPPTTSNITATLSTIEQQPIPGRRSFVRNARPLSDATSPAVVINYRDTQAASLAAGPSVAMTSTGSCPQRINARFVQAQVSVVPYAFTTFTHIEGVELDVVPGGTR